MFLLSLSESFHVFGALDKTSSSFSAHGKIGNFIIIIINRKCYFYLNVTTVGSLLSQFRLSSVVSLSVTLVHPTQGVEPFGNISLPLAWSDRPLTSVQNFTEIVPGGTSPPGYQNRAMVDISKALSHKRYKIDV